MDDKEKAIDLIQKCLRLSESSNENEAEVALGKAQELLERHNLTMEEIRLADDGTPPPEMINQDIQIGNSKWRKYLLFYIAKNNFCSTVSGRDGNVHLLGRTPNVAAVIEMTNWVMPQLDRMATEEAGRIKGMFLDPVTRSFVKVNNESKLAFRNDFLWGATKRVNERLKESRQERVDSNPNIKALVVNLSTELNTFVSSTFPYLSKGNVKIRKESNGYSAGYSAGNNVSLVQPSRHLESGGKYLTGGR